MAGKRILILGNYPPPFGGVPRHIEYLAPILVRRGWSVHILSSGRTGTFRHGGLTVYKLPRPQKALHFVRYGVSLFACSRKHLNDLWTGSTLAYLGYLTWAAIAKSIIVRERIALIAAFNALSAGPVAAILNETLGIPVVLTNLGEMYTRAEFCRDHRRLLRFVCEHSSALVAPTRHCARGYESVGLPYTVRVIGHGVDLSRFSPTVSGGEIHRKHKVSHDSNLVLFVGRLNQEMGLDTAIAAARTIVRTQGASTSFLFVGQNGPLLGAAKQLQEEHPRLVAVVPDVPFDELPKYYAACTLLVAPTKGDRACGSLAALEAMATGRPVVAARVGGIPEKVIDGETGILVAPDSPEELVRAISRVCRDGALARRMGAAGRKFAERHFDAAKLNEELAALFEEQLTG